MVLVKQSSVLRSAILAHCPRCGRGALFQKFLQLKKNCTQCTLDYSFVDTGDGPAIFVIFILGFGVLGAALWFEFAFSPPPLDASGPMGIFDAHSCSFVITFSQSPSYCLTVCDRCVRGQASI